MLMAQVWQISILFINEVGMNWTRRPVRLLGLAEIIAYQFENLLLKRIQRVEIPIRSETVAQRSEERIQSEEYFFSHSHLT
jgi:hypothetical protein